MAISSVTSESLQLKLRQLLPSQQGFGTDLTAQDTIVPVVDLTASAEGSDVRQDLQTALSFGSVTAHSVSATTTELINTTGFYRVFGAISFDANTSSSVVGFFTLSDGVTDKIILQAVGQAPGDFGGVVPYDFVVFLAAGETLSATAPTSAVSLRGCTRQIADNNGTLVQPVGFNPQ